MEDLKQLEEQYKKLGDEIARLKSKPTIDWSKMPVDTLVEVKDVGDSLWRKRYLSRVDGGRCYTFWDGATSNSIHALDDIMGWDEIRLIENEPKPWFGGECPIPDGIRFRWWMRDSVGTSGSHVNTDATKMCWTWGGHSDDIIAYQILGEE